MINFRILDKKGIFGYSLLLLGLLFFFVAFVKVQTRDYYIDILLNEPYGFNYLDGDQQKLLWFARIDVLLDDRPLGHIPVELDSYPEFREWIYSASPVINSIGSNSISDALKKISLPNKIPIIFAILGLFLHIIFFVSLPFIWSSISKPFHLVENGN